MELLPAWQSRLQSTIFRHIYKIMSLNYENSQRLEQHSLLSLTPAQVMEIILDALRELIDYELAVVLRYEPPDRLTVQKAMGALSTSQLEHLVISLDKRPDLASILANGRPRLFGEDEPHLDTYYEILDLPHGHSCLVTPLVLDDKPIGMLTFDHRSCNRFTPSVVGFVGAISKLIALSLVQAEASSALISRTRELVEERNRLLHPDAEAFMDLIGASEAFRRVTEAILLVAHSEVPVLLTGETGTGKEQVARKIHQLSPRAQGPFVAVNCSALPSGLAESELFGHEKGAFSGAVALRKGRFELAKGGTLFLDEVGDLPLELQPKLLRVLQDGTFERVGGERSLHADVRILAATNKDLTLAIHEGSFREDLWYRLNVFPIHLPPLREREQDALLLAEYFVGQIRKRTGYEQLSLAPSAVERILALPWRGNVRELRNALERAAILARGGSIEANHIMPLERQSVGTQTEYQHEVPAGTRSASAADKSTLTMTMEEVQRQHILSALEQSNGRIHGPSGAAALLGMKPTTLQSRMKKLGIIRVRSFSTTDSKDIAAE